MSYKYNEKEYANEIINNGKGFISTFISYELLLIVKKMKYEGKSRKETEDFLYEFCTKHIEDFNKVLYYKIIDKALRDGRNKNNSFIVVDSVNVSASEIKYINGLEIDDNYKKILLCFIIDKKIAYAVNKIDNSEAKLSSMFSGTKQKRNRIFTIFRIRYLLF